MNSLQGYKFAMYKFVLSSGLGVLKIRLMFKQLVENCNVQNPIPHAELLRNVNTCNFFPS